MKYNSVRVFILLAALTFGIAFAPSECLAKKWSVTERIDRLSKDIDEGAKANELTTKQVETLKKMAADIKERMETMKAKNSGKLSLPDTRKLHNEMNDLSVKTLRDRLENVYSD